MAHIYVASPAGRQSSETSWARLGLFLSSGQHHTIAGPEPLGMYPQKCLIKSAAQPSTLFTLTSELSLQP